MQQLNPSEISDLIKQRIDQVAVVSQAPHEDPVPPLAVKCKGE